MAGRGLYGGGRPPFGFDVVDDMLVRTLTSKPLLSE